MATSLLVKLLAHMPSSALQYLSSRHFHFQLPEAKCKAKKLPTHFSIHHNSNKLAAQQQQEEANVIELMMLSLACRRFITSSSVSRRALASASRISSTDVAERTKRMLDAKEQSGLSYDELASKLGVTNTYTAQLLMGQAKLTAETAVKLQEALPTASQQDIKDMQNTYPNHFLPAFQCR